MKQTLKQAFVVILILCGLAYTQEPTRKVKSPQRIQLTPAQVQYYQRINDEIEALPEVKAKRAQQAAFIAGAASTGGFVSWKLDADGKGGLYIEATESGK